MEASALAAPKNSQAGQGQYAARKAGASKPYAALGSNHGPGPRLVRTLGWWARLELHLGYGPSLPGTVNGVWLSWHILGRPAWLCHSRSAPRNPI